MKARPGISILAALCLLAALAGCGEKPPIVLGFVGGLAQHTPVASPDSNQLGNELPREARAQLRLELAVALEDEVALGAVQLAHRPAMRVSRLGRARRRRLSWGERTPGTSLRRGT